MAALHRGRLRPRRRSTGASPTTWPTRSRSARPIREPAAGVVAQRRCPAWPCSDASSGGSECAATTARTFWRVARPALRAGQIEALIQAAVVSHHLIEFTRQCLRGAQRGLVLRAPRPGRAAHARAAAPPVAVRPRARDEPPASAGNRRLPMSNAPDRPAVRPAGPRQRHPPDRAPQAARAAAARHRLRQGLDRGRRRRPRVPRRHGRALVREHRLRAHRAGRGGGRPDASSRLLPAHRDEPARRRARREGERAAGRRQPRLLRQLGLGGQRGRASSSRASTPGTSSPSRTATRRSAATTAITAPRWPPSPRAAWATAR